MEDWVNLSKHKFEEYFDSFKGLSKEQTNNFQIKKYHSIRVADLAVLLAEKLTLSEEEKHLAYFIGLFHDIGRFKQLVEYNTFNDSKSVDHAEYSVKVLKEGSFCEPLNEQQTECVYVAIQYHNKRTLPKGLSKDMLMFASLIRDVDKLDILKVLTDYYTNTKTTPNHALTWEMPKGVAISPGVSKEILAGSLVSKEKVVNELDIKVMQMSWVYDINFKPSFEVIMAKRYLEKIYNSLPKNDTVIEIFRKVKVYAQNKFIE